MRKILAVGSIGTILIILLASFSSMVSARVLDKVVLERIKNKIDDNDENSLFELILAYIWAIVILTKALIYYLHWLFFGILPPVAR